MIIRQEYVERKGFKYDDSREEYVSKKTYFGISTGDDKKLILSISEGEKDYRLHIYYEANRGNDYTVFDGFIEDQDDLDTILRMLKIN